MPTVYANTTGTTQVSNLVVSATDRYVEHGLRAAPLFRNFADKRPVQVTGPAATVTLNLYADIATTGASITAATLSESTDPDPITLSNTTQVTINLAEYGESAYSTRKVELVALSDIDVELLDQIVWHMQDSLDWLSQTSFVGKGANVITASAGTISTLAANSGAADYVSAGTGCTAIAATQTLTAKQIRYGVTKLRAGKVPGRKGNLYATVLAPEASADLREETGMAAWRDPHAYSAPQNIWDGELGAFEGAFFIESPRVFNSQCGSGATVRVFNTYMFGQQFLAESVAQEPHIEYGNMVDRLNRFRPVGWYGFLGWAPYRTAALVQICNATTARPTT